MGLAIRVALLALALAPLAASAANGPQVVFATPGGKPGSITRFTAHFSEAMVPLGGPRAAGPFSVDCPVEGSGRWADPQTYVYDFLVPLPGGARCTFAVRSGVRSVAGYGVVGQQSFIVDSGGPRVREVLPARYDGDIEERQVFLLATNTPADRASVSAHGFCSVDGIGEQIPVDLLGDDVPAEILTGLGTEDYSANQFREAANVPAVIPADARGRARALRSVIALRCRRPLPPGRDMALVWSGKITGGGQTAGEDQRFDFTVRKPFMASFECTRENPQAGCSPVEAARLTFSASIPTELAARITLTTADGKTLAAKPDVGDDSRTPARVEGVRFPAPLPPPGTAELRLPPGITDQSGRPLANAARFPLKIRIAAPPPLAKFAGAFGILEAREGGVLPLTLRGLDPALAGRRGDISGKVLRVTGGDAAITEWLGTVETAGRYASHEVKRGAETETVNDTGAEPVLAKGEGAPIRLTPGGNGRAMQVIGIPLKDPGFYVVELASPVLGAALLGRPAPRYVATAALVTNMAVHFKWGRERSLAWVTALDSGRPIARAEVRVSDACTGKLLARGTTDRAGGLYVRGLPPGEAYAGCPAERSSSDGGAHPLIVSARMGGDFSFTLTDWGNGLAPYDFDLPFGYEAADDIFHTVFDRALVRQGETLHMKHLLRAPRGQGFALARGFTGTLRLSHSGSDTSFDLPITIGPGGSGETSWTVPKGAPLGDYDLQLVRGDQTLFTSQHVRVDEYRLPTMRASITAPQAPLVRPRRVPLDLFVGFLSGGGAARLPVDLRIAWSRSERTPEGYESYDFGGLPLKEGMRPLNSSEEDALPPLPPAQTLPVVLDGKGSARPLVEVPGDLGGNSVMRLEMDYQDANGEVLTAAQQVPVYAAAVQLGIKTDGWLMKADDLRLKLVALDVNGRPVRGQRISVALYRREILTARRRLIGGFYAYDNQEKVTRLPGGCTATSDGLGLALCRLSPGVSGEIYAVATTRDAEGNEARATRSLWVAGDEEWWFGGDNGDRMDVVPEQTAYRAGETARFQVRMPFRSATALVTVEREGVLDSRVVALSGRNPVIELPMPGGYAPEVYVSVLAVRGRLQPSAWDWLTDFAAWLGLAAPREPAEAATALVDLAKPAFRLGIARVKVGWEAHQLKVAVRADRERYAPRQRAAVEVKVTRPDGRPAAGADVAFVAVDEALLQIAPNDSWDVLRAMMGERSLSVLTATAQMQVVGKRHYGRKAVAPGGGGGADAAALNRENFQPVLLWRGHVPLDPQGRARLAVPLSDALSRFRLVAVASEGAQLFGTGETAVRAAQDLSIFAGVPPLVRSGDQFGAIFTLRNGSTRPMRVTAEVALSPQVATGRPQTVMIPAGGAAPILWSLTAPQTPGTLRWQVRARAEGQAAADAITVTQEIVPLVPIETWAAALTRVGAAPLPIAAPAGALPGRGGLSVGLADTVPVPLAAVRDYMRAYPFNCLEQQTSRIISLGDAAGWARLAGELPSYQDSDGLLRYFPGETLQGSEQLTAYLLAITSEAGLTLPEAPRARMIAALRAVVDGRLRRSDFGDARFVRIAAFNALARAGAATPAMLGQLPLGPRDMPTSLLADYLIALDRLNAPDGAARRAEAEAVLRTRLVYEGTRIDLADDDQPWWLMASEDEAAVKAVLAVAGKPGWANDLPRLVTGAALRQRQGHWDTTPANAWGVLLARRVAALFPPGGVSGTTRLQLGPASATRRWPLADPLARSDLPLPAAQTPLLLSHQGSGAPFAMVALRAAVPLRAAVNAGYRLSRAVSVVSAKHPGRLTRGDVLRVTLTVTASAARNWVVISDPVPPGASILGGDANQSQLLNSEEAGGPSYVERGGAMWRGYYAWLDEGTTTMSYTVRLNGTGRFALPPSRVEALYSPELFAALPNAPVAIAVN